MMHIQDLYQWHPSENAVVYKAWERVMSSRYSGQCRRDAAHRATMDNITVGNDLSVLKPYTPSWIDQAHWDNMIDRLWNTSRWKKKSNVARQNRLTEVDGEVSKHTAGSKTILQHKFQMEKEKKRPVSLLEAYHRTHTSTNVSSEASGSGMDEASEGRTREYVTASSKRVADAVEAAIVEEYMDQTLLIMYPPMTLIYRRGYWDEECKLLVGTRGIRGSCDSTPANINFQFPHANAVSNRNVAD
ncbi:transposase, Ptta/En/Spm [Tanacetum coccineum]